jgi:hypothetical protein
VVTIEYSQARQALCDSFNFMDEEKTDGLEKNRMDYNGAPGIHTFGGQLRRFQLQQQLCRYRAAQRAGDDH